MADRSSIEWTDALLERFWRYVRKTEGCWEWTGGRFQSSLGYGQFRVGKRKVRAHRFAWQITNGSIPNGMRICHKCDNPTCCNPTHLFMGTDADNIADRGRKGRTKNGSRQFPELWSAERNPAAKVNWAAVHEIRLGRLRGRTLSQLSTQYGISISQVRNIVNNTNWRVNDGAQNKY